MYVDENGQLLGEIVWNTQVIADAIRSVQPGLDWPAVIRGLDNPEFYVVDQRGLSIVVDLYRRSGCHEPFPADFFLTPWRHPSAQLSFLRASLFVDPSVFTFEPGAATPNAAGSGGEFNPWLYPPFVEAFLRISEYPECSTSVRALFESLIKPMSEELLYMMYEFKENYALKRDILIVLENLFFSASYNPTIVNRIWSRNRQALLSSLCNLYLRDVDKLSHILDITHQEQRIQDDDGIFEALLDTKPYIFAIDLATLASTREYLNLDLWLRSKMQKDGKQFIETCVTYLFLKLRQRAGANVMLSKFQLTADAFTIFMNNLQVYIPAQLFATTKELAYIYNEYVKLVQFQKAQQLQQLQIQQAQQQAQQQQAQQQMGMESVEQSIYNSQQQAQQQFQQIMNLERQQQIQHAQAQLQAQQQQIQLQQQQQRQQQLQMQQAQQMQQMQQMQQAQMKAQNQMASNGAEGGGEGEMMQNEGEDGGEGNNGSSEKEDGNGGGGDDEAAGGEDGKDDSAVVPIGCLGNGDLVEYFVKDATLDDEKRADICVQYIYDGVLTAGEFADILKRITTLEKGDEDKDKDKDKSAADYEKRKRKEPRYMRLVEKFFGEVRLLEKKSYAQADALGETLGTMVHRSAIHREDLLNGLSCVLQLISGAPGTRSFRFATTAIAQFYTDLYKWKNYTTKLSQVPNLENFAPGVYGLIAYGRAASLATASLATTAASVAVERAAGGVPPAAVAAADNATRPYLQPDKFKVSEYIQMIFNNLSQQNLGEMVKGFRGYFDPGKDSYDDLALSVLARVLNEANHHGLYAAFIFAVGSAPLTKRILRFSYRKSAALLAAFAARYDGSGSPAETAALKQLHCLGNWLGALTLARDTPLLRAELDVLGLVRGARGSPAMSYVMPFVSDVLVHCASSTAFRPPNAWIVAVLDALADILGDTLALKQKVVHEIRRIFEALAVDPADFGSERRRRHKPLRGTAAGKKSKHAGKRKIKAQGEDSTISITPPPASALGLPSTSSGSPEPTSSSSSSESESPPLVESPEVPRGCGARSEEPHEFICEVLRRSVKVSNSLRVLGGAVAPALLFRETVNATARIVEMICRGEVPNAVSTAVGTTKALVLKDFAGDGREERFVEACTTMAKALASEVILISCKHTLRQLMADALAVMLCDLCGPNTPELLLGDVAKLLVHDNFDAACAAVARRAETVAEAEILEATRAERAERRAHWQENGVTARFRGKPGAKPLTERQLNVYRDFGATPVILSTPDLSKTSDAEQKQKQKQKQQETQQQQDSQQQQQQQQQQEPEDPAAAAAAKKEEMLKVAVARVKGALNAEKVFSDDADAHIRTDVGSQYLLFLKKLTSVCAQLPPDQDIRQLPQSHALFGVLSEFAQIIVDALHILVTNSRARLQQAIQTRREKINRSRIARRARLRLQRRRHHEAIMGITMGAEFDTAAAATAATPSSTAAFLTAGGVVNREGAMGIIGNSHVDVDEIDFISSSDEVDDDDDDDDILDDIDDDEEEEDEEDDGDAEDNYIRIDDIDEEEEMMMSDRETMRCIEECMSVIRPVFRHLVDGNARRPLQDAVFMLLAQCGEDAVEYTTQCYMALSFEKLVTPDLLARLIGYRLVSVPTIDDFLSAKLQTPGAQSAAQALRNLAAQVLYVFVCSHKIPANDFSKTITVCNGLAPQVQVFAASLKIKEAEDQQKAQQQAALQAQLQAKLQAAAASNDEARYTIPCIIAFNEWCDALEAYGENDVTRVFLQLQAIIQVCRDTFFNKAFLVAMETYWFAPPGSAARCVKLNAYGNLVIRLCQYVSKDPNAQVQYFVRSLRTFVVEFMEKGSEDPRPFLYLLNYWAAHYDQFPNNNNNGSSGNGGNNGGNPAAAAAAAGEQGGRVKEPLDVFFNVLVSYIHPSKNPLLAYGWLEIISQEALLRRVLQNRQNWGMMQRQLVLLLRFLSLSVTTLGTAYAAGTIDAPASEQLHAYIKEVVALFIKIQNMCPAFLAAYHFSLCNAIPENFVNLRNIILASSPVMVPSPFTNIVVERIPESNMAPLLADNYMTVLEQRIPIDALTACVRDPTGAPYFWVQTSLFPLLDAPSDPAKRVEAATVFNALVLCLGDLAVRTPELKNAIYFVIKRLILILPPNGSLALINAMANQLRFPNVHTIYFSKILITFFSSICSPEYTKEQITRVLCERIQRSQVQPWGIMVTCTELLLNQKYDIFSCEFINEYPLIAKTLRTYRDKFKKLFTQQKLQIQQQQQQQQQQQLQAQQVQQQQQQQIY